MSNKFRPALLILVIGAVAALMVLTSWVLGQARGTSDPHNAFTPEIPSTEP